MTLSIVRGVALVVAASITVPGVALAQDASAPPAPAMADQTSPPTPQPSLWMIGGITSLAFSYAPAAVVAATSGLTIDRTLLVPVIGPWIDLTQRPACPGGVCSDNASKELLVLDGAFQAASLLAIIVGLVSPSPLSATVSPSASPTPTIRVSAAPVGASGHGMVALGTF